ncbi:MAG TPA: hypothetical protein VIM61_03400 [Chthoniobacterales bacterium]
MTTHSKFLFGVIAFLSLTATTQATMLGISDIPAESAWNRGDVGTAYATWDSFSNVDFTSTPAPAGTMTFSNLAPGESSGTTSATLAQSVAQTNNFAQGAGVYDFVGGMTGNTYGTDVFLNGGNNVTFTINATLNFTAYGVILQIKRAGSTATLADANGFTPILTINSTAVGADGFYTTTGSGDTNSTAGTYSVTTWYWDASLAGLTDTGSSTVSIALPKNNSFSRSIDAFSVDFASVTAVPEPGTWAIGGALVALLAFRVYRTRATRIRG